MVEVTVAYTAVVGKPDQKRPFGSPVVDGRIILRWIFKREKGA
jgi:hypothetical protein